MMTCFTTAATTARIFTTHVMRSGTRDAIWTFAFDWAKMRGDPHAQTDSARFELTLVRSAILVARTRTRRTAAKFVQ